MGWGERGFFPWLNYRIPHQRLPGWHSPCAPVSLLMSQACTGRSPANVAGTNILREFHCFCHKGHLVVKLETKNGISYLINILKSKSVYFVWWVSTERRGADNDGEGGTWNDFSKHTSCIRLLGNVPKHRPSVQPHGNFFFFFLCPDSDCFEYFPFSLNFYFCLLYPIPFLHKSRLTSQTSCCLTYRPSCTHSHPFLGITLDFFPSHPSLSHFLHSALPSPSLAPFLPNGCQIIADSDSQAALKFVPYPYSPWVCGILLNTLAILYLADPFSLPEPDSSCQSRMLYVHANQMVLVSWAKPLTWSLRIIQMYCDDFALLALSPTSPHLKSQDRAKSTSRFFPLTPFQW